ncbi:MAG: ABC-F family ATP-binding cassette domain-containing protein [Clostridia bacterium]
MSILSIKNLSHIFESKTLFENASFEINNGEHVGIVGLNGAGKTTFMNIISGKIIQDSGEVKWLNGIKWDYLDQHADIDRTKTVMQYLESSFSNLFELEEKMQDAYAKMAEEDADFDALMETAGKIQDKLLADNFYEIETQIKKVASGLGVSNFGYDTLISTLSGGQRTKLMLAKLLIDKPQVMLLDEPTNFLDLEHIDWLANYLNSFEGTILLVSHDTEFLDKVCNLIINVGNKDIKRYPGSYSYFLEQYEIEQKQMNENYARQQREVKKIETFIAKNKARAATAGMANSRKKLLDKMEIIDKPSQVYEAVFNFPYKEIVTKEMLKVNSLEIGYDKPLLPPLDMLLGSNSKIWIRGTNGIGKSTFLKTIMGEINSLSGEFQFHPFAKIGYLEQDMDISTNEKNATAYINELYPKMNNRDIKDKLSKVGIKNELLMKSLSKMSGGEQVRVKLLSISLKESNILILDEPTNHLDVLAKNALKNALIAYEGAIILVSHEPSFAEEICSSVFDVVQ